MSCDGDGGNLVTALTLHLLVQRANDDIACPDIEVLNKNFLAPVREQCEVGTWVVSHVMLEERV